MLDFKIASGDFYEIPDLDKGTLRFKNAADLLGFYHLLKILPELRNIKFRHKEFFPYYGEDLQNIEEALKNHPETVAVEGGPCLFGEHEVDTIVTMNDGTKYLFDYSTGKKYRNIEKAGYAQSDQDLAVFVEENKDGITDISFVNHKSGLTYQEYLHVFFPFAIADSLKCALVMTLPDMSYRKYLLYISKSLDEKMAEKVMKEFDEILYGISDMYIELIDKLKEKFRIKKFAFVHGRDEEMMKLYEEKRAPFIERNKILKSLTSNDAKLESIKDYISMPALPYYIFGSENILEVNSMDETDSYRKCRKAHKSVLSLSCILFPELLSRDGENTIYCTDLEYKDYGNYVSELE
ncbi:MAG: hypothetical protein J6S49_03385 [Erysipelotrichaceae bacterium]|nr:hypothetical protein [Erysipelotrichaceae bacterium]